MENIEQISKEMTSPKMAQKWMRVTNTTKKNYFTSIIREIINLPVDLRNTAVNQLQTDIFYSEPYFITRGEIPISDYGLVPAGYTFKRGCIEDCFYEARLVIKIQNRRGLQAPRFFCIRQSSIDDDFIKGIKK